MTIVAPMMKRRRNRGTRFWCRRIACLRSGWYDGRTAACTTWISSFIAASSTAASVYCPRWRKTLSSKLEQWWVWFVFRYCFLARFCCPEMAPLVLRPLIWPSAPHSSVNWKSGLGGGNWPCSWVACPYICANPISTLMQIVMIIIR